MKSIWKFSLNIVREQNVRMPWGAKILNVAYQGNDLVVWAVVDTTNSERLRKFAILGTGQPYWVGDNAVYVGTVQTRPSGSLVWHVFDLGEGDYV